MAAVAYSFLLLLTFLVGTPAWAVQHIVPGADPHAFQDMIHHPSAAQMRAAGGSLQVAMSVGSSGPHKVAVIIVQFPAGNASLISGSRSIQSVANVQNYFNQMHNYYLEASYGSLILNFVYFNSDTATVGGDANPSSNQTGVYTMTHPMEYYGCGDEGVGCPGVTVPAQNTANGNYLTRDAID